MDDHAPPHGERGAGEPAPSKTQRKKAMHALQALGEELARLDEARLSELGLPERLAEALRELARVRTHEGRRRQAQYVGRLMRDVDPAPVRARLELWARGPLRERERLHEVEGWRDRLMSEPAALEALAARCPALDRARVRALVDSARAERAEGGPPHAARRLFRALRALLHPNDE